jgi:hypothetical protein
MTAHFPGTGISIKSDGVTLVGLLFIIVFSHYDSKFIMVLKEALSILHRYVILASMYKITLLKSLPLLKRILKCEYLLVMYRINILHYISII